MNLQAFRLTYFTFLRTACFPFFYWECKVTGLFLPAKIIFLIFNFLTSHQNDNPVLKKVQKKRTVVLIFFADCKDTVQIHFQPNLYRFYFTKICETDLQFSRSE